MKKKVVITGATGLVGQALVPLLLDHGYEIIVVSRNPYTVHTSLPSDVKAVSWEPFGDETLTTHIEDAFGVINLAGENIGEGRWTPHRRERILQSRIAATQTLVKAIRDTRRKPRVLLQASAIGFYGIDRHTIATETSPRGAGFLADVAFLWEQQSLPVETLSTRLVRMRLGVVLAGNGGAFPKLKLPFSLFAGGPPGNGKQWLSWIHITDLAVAMLFLLENDEAEGVFNLCAPHPVRMNDFASVLGREMNRPSFFRVPAAVLRLALGDMADEMILGGARVSTERLPEAGFRFTYPTIEESVAELITH